MNTALNCSELQAVLDALPPCEETSQGLRISTHCMYPSFDPVHVYVVGIGGAYTVHDGGGAARAAWAHGRDLGVIRRALAREAMVHQLQLRQDTLSAEVPTAEWLLSGMLGVANASAAAARAAVDAVQHLSEKLLKEMISSVLHKIFTAQQIAAEYEIAGQSGKRHQFDFCVRPNSDAVFLVDALSPHHVSIASKYVSFADTTLVHPEVRGCFAVHDRPLSVDDRSLLTQVADVVPLDALEPGLRARVLRH